MAKVNIIRWDDLNVLSKLLDKDDVAMVNHIDITGSSGDLTIGSGSATNVVLGNSGNTLILSGSSLFKVNATLEDNIKVILGTNNSASIYYDTVTSKIVM